VINLLRLAPLGRYNELKVKFVEMA